MDMRYTNEGTVASEFKGRLKDKILLLQLIILISLIVSSFFVPEDIRWTLGLFILFFAGVVTARELSRGMKKTSVWRRESGLSEFIHRELPQTSELVERAFQGKRLSQAILEQRLKGIFIDKVKDKRNLSKSDMDDLLQDEEKLDRVIRDDKITDFLINVSDPSDTISKDEDVDLERDMLKRGGKDIDTDYKEQIEEIIDRMRRWS